MGVGAGVRAGADSRPQAEARSAEAQVPPAVVTQARGGGRGHLNRPIRGLPGTDGWGDGRHSSGGRFSPGNARERSSAASQRPWRLSHGRRRAVVCAGGGSRRPDSGRPRKPRNGECAGRLRRRSYGAGRNRRNLPAPPAGLLGIRSESACLSPGPPLGPVFSGSRRGGWTGHRDPGILSGLRGTSRAGPGTPLGVSADGAAAGSVARRPSRFALPSLSVGGAAACGTPQVSRVSPSALVFPLSFPDVGGAGCPIHVPGPQPSSSWGWQTKTKQIPKFPGPSPRSQIDYVMTRGLSSAEPRRQSPRFTFLPVFRIVMCVVWCEYFTWEEVRE